MKRPAEEGASEEQAAKRPAVANASALPEAVPPITVPQPAGVSSNANGGPQKAGPATPQAGVDGTVKASGEGLPQERMVAGAGARTVAARMMGSRLAGGPEDSNGSATVTQGGYPGRGGQSDEEDDTSSCSEGSLGGDGGVPVAVELTPEEVARRRGARMTRLLKLYRMQYWGLCQEMRSKHRRFFLRQGNSGWKEDAPEGGMRPGCSKAGCQDRAMFSSSFCFRHILCDPRQQLYCACIHSPTPDDACPRPVLRAVVPPLCAPHAALRRANQSSRKLTNSAGSSAGGATSSSSALVVPPVHVLINEYIRVLQRSRTVMAKARNSKAVGT